MKRILVMDDEPSVLAVVKDVLGTHGYTVIGVTSVADALSRLEIDTFDLVIADLRMGEVPGQELIRHLRATQGYQDLPIVVLATGAEEAQLGALRVDMRVSKPFSPPTLVTAVTALIG